MQAERKRDLVSPSAMRALQFSASWWDVEYKNGIGCRRRIQAFFTGDANMEDVLIEQRRETLRSEYEQASREIGALLDADAQAFPNPEDLRSRFNNARFIRDVAQRRLAALEKH